MTWFVLAAFIAVQFAIGAWASRRVSSESDYFVAGRRLGLPLVSISLFATWFGAETCLGSAGALYEDGLSGARADPLGYALCLVLLGALLSVRLATGNYLTLGDLFRQRFGPRAEKVLVLVLVPSSLVWAGAQVRALGQVLTGATGIELEAAIAIGAAVSVVYTFFGGLLGDVLTDLIQGIVLAAGLVLLGVAVCLHAPPDLDLRVALTPERLSPLGSDGSVLAQLDRFLVPVLGSLVSQELVARVLAARTPTIAKRSAYVAAGVYFAIGCIPALLGLLGPALLPHLADPEALLPELARAYLNPALFLVFSCALLAAILSTLDSIFLSCSALVAHNVVTPLLRDPSERTKLVLGRVFVALSGLVAVTVALASDGIYTLVESASSLGTAGVLVTTLAALARFGRSELGALVALGAGAVGTPVLELLGAEAPFLSATLLALASYVGVLHVERSKAEPSRTGPSASA